MYRWELVEWNDRPKDLWRPYFETGPGISTMSLMWRMTRPLWARGKAVIMYSTFYLIKELIGMYERGFLGIAVINKRRYWPEGIHGNQINVHLEKIK